jgi:hypothetical protein
MIFSTVPGKVTAGLSTVDSSFGDLSVIVVSLHSGFLSLTVYTSFHLNSQRTDWPDAQPETEVRGDIDGEYILPPERQSA